MESEGNTTGIDCGTTWAATLPDFFSMYNSNVTRQAGLTGKDLAAVCASPSNFRAVILFDVIRQLTKSVVCFLTTVVRAAEVSAFPGMLHDHVASEVSSRPEFGLTVGGLAHKERAIWIMNLPLQIDESALLCVGLLRSLALVPSATSMSVS